MITKELRPNPKIASSIKKMVDVEIGLLKEEIILYCTTYYKEGNLKVLPELTRSIEITTRGHMVDSNGVGVEVSYENTDSGEYPQGSIPEIVFFKNIPVSAFPQIPTVWGIIEGIVTQRIDRLDHDGFFN